MVELEEARATIPRRRAAHAPGPSQAASLPAAGGWMGRLQAAAAAAEAAAAAAAVSAASTNHLTHPSIGNQGPRSARRLLSPPPLPHGRAPPGRLLTSGAGLPSVPGGLAAWRRYHLARMRSFRPAPDRSFGLRGGGGGGGGGANLRCFRGAPGLRCGVSLRGGQASSRPFRSALPPRQGCGFLATPPWLHLCAPGFSSSRAS